MNERKPAEDPELGDLIRAKATRHAPAAALRERLVAAIRDQDAPFARVERHSALRRWWPAGVAFACGALLSWLALSLAPRTDTADPGERDILNAHVRAVMMARAVDIASSDRHTVKPWLSSRLDFSPPVHDLTAEGFPLTGGRLDYVHGRTVAVLVYRRNQHSIDVFVAPVAGKPPPGPSQGTNVNGFNVVSWRGGGLEFRAISDLSASELNVFGNSLQARIASGS